MGLGVVNRVCSRGQPPSPYPGIRHYEDAADVSACVVCLTCVYVRVACRVPCVVVADRGGADEHAAPGGPAGELGRVYVCIGTPTRTHARAGARRHTCVHAAARVARRRRRTCGRPQPRRWRAPLPRRVPRSWLSRPTAPSSNPCIPYHTIYIIAYVKCKHTYICIYHIAYHTIQHVHTCPAVPGSALHQACGWRLAGQLATLGLQPRLSAPQPGTPHTALALPIRASLPSSSLLLPRPAVTRIAVQARGARRSRSRSSSPSASPRMSPTGAAEGHYSLFMYRPCRRSPECISGRGPGPEM
jgi:hypothetical protein